MIQTGSDDSRITSLVTEILKFPFIQRLRFFSLIVMTILHGPLCGHLSSPSGEPKLRAYYWPTTKPTLNALRHEAAPKRIRRILNN